MLMLFLSAATIVASLQVLVQSRRQAVEIAAMKRARL